MNLTTRLANSVSFNVIQSERPLNSVTDKVSQVLRFVLDVVHYNHSASRLVLVVEVLVETPILLERKCIQYYKVAASKIDYVFQ